MYIQSIQVNSRTIRINIMVYNILNIKWLQDNVNGKEYQNDKWGIRLPQQTIKP